MTTKARTYLSTKEVADEFAFSVSTLTKLRVFGGGPLFYKLGRRVVYRRQDIESWITDHARRSTSETEASISSAIVKVA